MENMSNVPYYVPGARSGVKFGHQKVVDGMIKDGLWDVYNDYHMGNAAELCAREMNVHHPPDQDEFAKPSYRARVEAQKAGLLQGRDRPGEVPQRRATRRWWTTDEEPGRGNPTRCPALRPAFDKNGTVTAANASSSTTAPPPWWS
jgi:acetyl-CoA C-acetyltransferase